MHEIETTLPLKQLGFEMAKFLLPIAIGVAVVAVLHYRFYAENETRLLEEREKVTIEFSANLLRARTGGIVSDTTYLARIAGKHLPFGDLALLRRELVDFSESKPMYDQVRVLSPSGRELVRINRKGDSVEFVGEPALQDKSSRYYFQFLQELGSRDIYLSPLDLNVDGGEIERPFKPTIRSGQRILAHGGDPAGWVVLNFSAEPLISAIERAEDESGANLMLLNRDGYWLASPDVDDEWGFMGLSHQRRFSERYESLWVDISTSESGQWYAEEGMVTFSTVRPYPSLRSGLNGHYYWKVVSLVAPEQLAAAGSSFMSANSLLYALFLTVGLVVSATGGLLTTRAKLAHLQRDYERHFRHVVQDMKLLAVGLDETGCVTYCNYHMLDVLGLENSEVVGRNWFECFVPAAERTSERARVLSVLKDGASVQPHQSMVQVDDGKSLIVDWNVTPTSRNGQRVSGLTLIGKDVTPQRRAEDQLRKLSQAVEQSPNTVMITNTRGEIEYVNPKFTKLTGYSLKEMLGQNPRILKSGDTKPEEYRALWRSITRGKEWRGEFHNKKKNGELYWEATAISAIRDEQGSITHYLAVKEDLTENKRLQQEADERKHEVNRNRELAVVGRMANMIAHDLRNPLSSLKIALQIVSKDQKEDETQELLQISLAQIRYMEQILSDLLSYSRPDALQPEWLSIDKLLETAVSFSQREIGHREISIITECQAGVPTLHGDRRRLVQAFSNLIVNSIQATEGLIGRTSEVRISTSLLLGDAGTEIQVEISDNGTGINPDTVDQLYEPFFTTRAKGTGLGLAIVKRIIGLHQGNITIEPQSGYGTRVVVTLPTGPLSEYLSNGGVDNETNAEAEPEVTLDEGA